MTTWQVILILIGVEIIGLLSLVYEYYHTLQRRNFAVEYFNKFQEAAKAFIENRLDHEVYRWLNYNSAKIQSLLGVHGELAYKPTASFHYINGYQVILNTIPQIRSRAIDQHDLLMVDDILVRFVGVLDEVLKDRKKELVNPIMWLREGVQWVLLLPVFVLKLFGLIGTSAVNGVSHSTIFKVFAFVIAMIGLVGSVVTVVLGWDEFMRIIQQLFQRS